MCRVGVVRQYLGLEVKFDFNDTAIVGGALADAAVGPVCVVVLEVIAQELFQVPALPDEDAVEELAAPVPTHRSAYALATGV
jgi:hypothetical protein